MIAMVATNTSPTAPLVVWVLISGLVGCGRPLLPAWSVWPFAPPERVDYETPGDRIARIEALGRQVAKSDGHRRQQLTAQLAEQIRHEQDPLVREHIIRALAQSSDPAATALLRAGLTDNQPVVRIACCRALASRHDDETLSALAEVLRQDADPDVRQAATRALGHFQGPVAVSALIVALEDRDPALQYLAVESLRGMTDVDYGNDVGRWLEYARGGRPQPQPLTLSERLRRISPF
jgi:hypothetical protein